MKRGCDNCGKGGALLRERLDPHTLRPIRALLCAPCGRADGFVQVSYVRAPLCHDLRVLAS